MRRLTTPQQRDQGKAEPVSFWAIGALILVACGDGERHAATVAAEGGQFGVGGSLQQSGAAGQGVGGGSIGAVSLAGSNAIAQAGLGVAGATAGSTHQGAAGGSGSGATPSGGISSGGTVTGGAGSVAAGAADAAAAGFATGGFATGGFATGGFATGGSASSSGAAGRWGSGGSATGGFSSFGGVAGTGLTDGGVAGRSTSGGGAAGESGTAGAAGESISYGGVPNAMGSCTGHYQMESLKRGVVAVAVPGGVYIGWRMSGCEYDPVDPSSISYNLYRGGEKLAAVTDSTNYFDATGTPVSAYTVRAVRGGVEQAESEVTSPWTQNYLRIPLNIPTGGTVSCPIAYPSCVATTQGDTAYTYNANDASTGDLDGDGAYDIVLKWDPTNSRDNALTGFTGNVVLDAYRLDGSQLWRIDLGKNIRAGAHYTQFLIYDLDGDGRAEVAMKTAPGTRDGQGQYLRKGPAATDDDTADYRNPNGMVLSGNEYLTVFSGLTGAELSTMYFVVDRSLVYDWGDSTGNRADRFLASVGFVSDLGLGQAASGRPSLLMGRGYYTRATLSAWNWRSGALSRIWLADSYPSTSTTLSAYGQGTHTMAVADVDQDGAQETIYGAATIDSNGAFKCSSGLGHGDALHVGDFVPTRPGLEVFQPHEGATTPSYSLRDANTCEVIVQGPVRGDTGRGTAGDIDGSNPGAEMWASGSTLLSAASGASVGNTPSSINFLIWWDADESRELLNDVDISKYGGSSLQNCSACASNNGTKATPVLTADLLGDWREEVLWRLADNSALRLYTTTHVTTRRIYTLMHDPQYRMQVSSEQTAYNQPPNPSFHIGTGMAPPPKPDIAVR